MEQNISDGMCRCCASEGSFKDLHTAYQWMGEEEVYAKMLKDCFDISLSTSELINNGGICEVCITQLRNAFNFKRQVQTTEEQFKKKVHETVFRSNTIKLEVSRGDGDSNHADSDNLSDGDYEVIVKEEKVEDKPKKRQAKATTSKAKKAKNDGETSKRPNDDSLEDKTESGAVETIKIEVDDTSESEEETVKFVIDDTSDSKEDAEENREDIAENKEEDIEENRKENREKDIEKDTEESEEDTEETEESTEEGEEDTEETEESTEEGEEDTEENEDEEYKSSGKNKEINMHRHNVYHILLNSNATAIRNYAGTGYTCDYCSKKFPVPGDLKKHVQKSHGNKSIKKNLNSTDMSTFFIKLDITELKCRMCDKNIDTVEKLITHLINTHKKKMYTKIKNQILPFKFDTEAMRCFMCNKQFHRFKPLKEHMHAHYKLYKCDKCDAGCVCRQSLVIQSITGYI